jgi:aspartate aminotransferase
VEGKKQHCMSLSRLSETLIGSEIVKLGGEIREKIRNGHKIYNFTVGDFDPSIFPIPKELEDEIINAFKNHFTNYPAAEGNLDLRLAIHAFLNQRQQLSYDPDEILVASGGRPLIYAAFRAICDAGDKVIYAVPSWNNNHYTHFVGGTHVVVEAKAEHNFMPTADEIRPHVNGATLIALCSPQNPTGTTFSRETLAEICNMIVEENESRGENEKKLYLLFDQMYWHLTYGKIVHYDPVNLDVRMKKYTIYIDAISKVFAATGLRVGWAMGPADLMSKMKAILTHVGAWAPMAEQKAVASFLKNEAAITSFLNVFKREIQLRLQRIYDGLKSLKDEGLPTDAIAPEGAIYLTVKFDFAGRRVNGRQLETQAEVTSYLLDEAKLAIVPFNAFGASNDSPWYRLSVGTCRKEEIGEMLRQLKTALEKIH